MYINSFAIDFNDVGIIDRDNPCVEMMLIYNYQ